MTGKIYAIMLKMNEGKKFDLPVIKRHVENLKKLDAEGKLVLCGPFKDFPGGMLVVKASSPKEARAIAASDPFVAEGFESFEVREWELASKENNYLL